MSRGPPSPALFVSVGLGCFYLGMGRGLISVVAPVAAVTGAVVPVIYALARGERPGPVAVLGLVAAFVAVTVVSLAPSEQHADAARRRPRGDRPRARGRAPLRPLLRLLLARLGGRRPVARGDRARGRDGRARVFALLVTRGTYARRLSAGRKRSS